MKRSTILIIAACLVLAVIAGMLLLKACSPQPTVTPTQTALPATATFTELPPTFTETLAITATPTPTQTRKPTATFRTPTIFPSITPKPTNTAKSTEFKGGVPAPLCGPKGCSEPGKGIRRH